MRCKDVEQTILETGNTLLPQSVRDHLTACAQCRQRWSDSRLLNLGFAQLAMDAAPEPTWGFASRVVRRLESAAEATASAAEFFERAGRRFVLASLLVTLSLLLAFALPSSGPLRGQAADEPYLAQPEPNQSTEAIVLGEDVPDSRNAVPANPTDGGDQRQK